MKRYFVSALLILTLISSVVAQENTTVWGPGENYTLAFLHSGTATLNETILYDFNNQPKTEFTVQNFTNTGYDYDFLGFGNFSENDHVDMIITTIPGFGSFEMPTGGFPVLLPREFNGKQEWPISFANALIAIRSLALTNLTDFSIFSFDINIDSETISLNFSTVLNTSLSDLEGQFMTQFFYTPRFDGGTFYNATFEVFTSYTISTGVLYFFNYELITDNFTNSEGIFEGSAQIIETLDFVAIVPPSTLINELPIGEIYIFMGILVIGYIKSRKR